jgi:hypothetical protein
MHANQRTYVSFKLTDSFVVIFQLHDKDLQQFFVKMIGLNAVPTILS